MVGGHMPSSLREALEIRASQDVVPYAGGTDLMPAFRPDRTFLFLRGVPELREIAEDDRFIRIGACVTFARALAHPLIPPVMKEAISRVGSPAIRNAGTLGGNVANGSDKADTVPVEFALDAKLRLVSIRGERIVDVERFHLGWKRTALADDELIAEILLPRTGWENACFHKVGGRRAMAISHVTFAGVHEERDGRIASLAVAFGAVADRILRFRDAEAMLLGRTPAEARALREAYIGACAERLATVNGRVSADYCRRVCLNLLRDFLARNGI